LIAKLAIRYAGSGFGQDDRCAIGVRRDENICKSFRHGRFGARELLFAMVAKRYEP